MLMKECEDFGRKWCWMDLFYALSPTPTLITIEAQMILYQGDERYVIGIRGSISRNHNVCIQDKLMWRLATEMNFQCGSNHVVALIKQSSLYMALQ